MPFVQRVVQPTRLALASASSKVDERTRTAKFHCTPGKCKNNNCINKQTTQTQPPQQHMSVENVREEACVENGGVLSRTTAIAKDTAQQLQQQQQTRSLAGTPTAGANHTTVTRAIIHVSQQNGETTSTLGFTATKTTATSAPTTPMRDVVDCSHHNHLHHQQHQQQLQQHNQTNGYTCSFSYATDTEEDISVASTSTPAAPLSLKKLKHHVEFLSTAPSPTRSASAGEIGQQQQSQRQLQLQQLQRQRQQQQQQQRTQSPTAAKIVSGHEFESISNLTLSNALRQLASLVLLANDIFDELQTELLSVGERARTVQRKIIAVEQRVSVYDPKMVTVPESDLLTFAQRKTHFECDKSIRKELFTATTRPPSVRILYEEAARVRPTPAALAYHSPHSPRSFTSADGVMVCGDAANADCAPLLDGMNAGDFDELVCTPVFGKTNRKMRTRIDAEIEIRLPAAIEDLRKWTSSEALGDMTVTPDCMHHVDTSISTSMVIGDNGVLTPALSPSVLSADAVDALYAINVSQIGDNTQLPNDINKDVPLNHRLPSPEEQCKIIALRYPAEVISVDTSGKRFQRMCAARKSTTGCYTGNMAETNNLNDDVQTVSRRSRSRRVRGKRRNTIAGTDQKEIQDAANGDSTATSGEIKNALNDVAVAATPGNANLPVGTSADGNDEDVRRGDKSKKFGRSKSSDILKKDAVALPYDKGKSTLTRLNSLKQWGRNRFKFMQRAETATPSGSDSGAHDVSACSSSSNSSQQQTTTPEKAEPNSGNTNASNATKASQSTRSATGDIDDECVVHDLVSQKSEGRFSHERKPSYSSSEKSMSVSSSGHLKGKLHLATCGNVKLRDTSSLNRQRRLGITNNGALGGKDEQPHSSSGNWSASSESGRASIGSEITIQPKSSASNTSLNVSSFHPGSGPPSSMMSRRRFLNTSASSSVTSEGTATPDLQVADGSYPNHLDDETSSAYSCDTEGYYTSFHMDSGLRTLKEEDPPMTPLQHNQMLHTSNYSFGSQSNQTVLTAENEYELFGKGSTSTTTSSAGTVCTTLLVGGEQSSLNSVGPDVPERISSLGKLNKNNHSNSASTSTLERSYSSSTIGSTLERTGTIKRNVNAGLKLNPAADAEDIDGIKSSFDTPESQEEEFDFEKRIRRRSAQPLPAVVAMSEVECSESSDLEGVERIERIKQKTAINVKRIPSMCIITPTTSDDENQSRDGGDGDADEAYDPDRTLTPQSSPRSNATAKAETTLKVKVNEVTGYCTVDAEDTSNKVTEAPLTPTKGDKDHNLNVLKRNSNYAFNMFEKLKVVLPSIKRSPSKSSQPESVVDDDELYDTAGEYVTIADISNNNRHKQMSAQKAVGASSLGIYYSNDIVRRKFDIAAASADAATKANEPAAAAVEARKRETEYVSLNELPQHLRKVGSSIYSSNTALSATANNEITDGNASQQEAKQTTTAHMYCAESAQQRKSVVESAVPMYAEISEVREQSLVSPLAQHKGARVRLNSQGKIIYESDSLKRRKGAHTTFAPGPYVKETESALPEIISVNAQTHTHPLHATQLQAQTLSQSQLGSESANATKTYISATPKTTAAKLLLLNGGVAANRKIANVRPIVAKSPLTLARQQQPQATQPNYTGQLANNQANMSLSSGLYEEPHTALAYSSSYQDNKNMLANNTNPFFQSNIIAQHAAAPATALMMMPSPSTKSTSSTGSTISSSASTNTSSGTSSASSAKEEGYQRFYRTRDQQQPLPQPPVDSETQSTMEATTPFQRNTPIYWTLQNRKQQKPPPSNVTCRDDLYATPIKRSERVARAAAAAEQNGTTSLNGASNLSPIVPRNRNGFQTSTPSRGDDAALAALNNSPCRQPLSRNPNWADDNSPERYNTCSDRIGHSKTSLLDFKKLLLAKSAKTSPVQRKLSAVELLKKTSPVNAATAETAPVNKVGGALSGTQTLNSSMKLLDLSGSPKTFANRRMLRQGQFGSPSKSFAPKLKSATGGGLANTVQRTNIMSTTIPEVNSEEDHSSTASSTNSSNASNDKEPTTPLTAANASDSINSRAYDLKRNFFLQTEENNFMRGEMKTTFGRSNNAASATTYAPAPIASVAAGTALTNNKYYGGQQLSAANGSPLRATTNYEGNRHFTTPTPGATLTPPPTAPVTTHMPALETAL
uniref:Nance-Horan syndrome protein n=1 Tax=Bactrocera dorsalis TaxID=27457 RepID=A0A034VCU7_BACDO